MGQDQDARVIDCVLVHWQLGIGDPTWQGWVTVLVYLATAILAFQASRMGFPAATRGQERIFWILTLLLLAGLAINKQLDLQSALTAAGRCMAKAQGWYSQRRLVQMGFLLGLAGLAVVFLAILLWLLRGSWSRNALLSWDWSSSVPSCWCEPSASTMPTNCWECLFWVCGPIPPWNGLVRD